MIWKTVLAVLMTATMAHAAPVFTKKPVASEKGRGATVAFAVSEKTDVAVCVLDAKGNVVRHLAAGVLGGKNAPPAPLKPGLSQSVVWDGNDDLRKPATGAPFKVRVGLGTQAAFDRILAWSGQSVEDIRGMACGPDGTLYLVYGGSLYAHRRSTIISAFDGDGQYLRQVLPGPGGLPEEKRKGWPHVKLDGGREVPLLGSTMARSVMPGAWLADDRMFPTVTGDGRLVVLNCTAGGFPGASDPDFIGGRRLLVFRTDGTVPQSYLGPQLAKTQVAGTGFVATSPDGKTAYVTGLGGGKVKRTVLPRHNVVYAVPLDGSAAPKVLIGKLDTPGKGKGGLTDPAGLATDKDGNIYVSDTGNDRIAVFSSDGAFIKEIAVKAPWQVHVSRRTGAIYVIAEKGMRLVKFGGLADPTQKASSSTDAKPYKIPFSTLMALDDSSEVPAVWLCSRFWHNGWLKKFADRGGRFESVADPIKKKLRKPAMNFTAGLALAGGRLMTRNNVFGFNWATQPMIVDLKTGRYVGTFGTRRDKINEVVAGKDGRFYTIGAGFKRPCPVNRFDASGKPLPFAQGGTINGFWHGHTRTFGMFVTRTGNLYLAGGDEYRALDPATVRRYGPDGKLIDRAVVTVHQTYLGGIAVDSKGSIYLGAQVVPKGELIPKWFAGKLPKNDKHGYPGRAYRQYGGIVKFAPTGGAIVKDANGKHFAVRNGKASSGPVTIRNGRWLCRAGEVPVRGTDDGVHCFCETSRFDIDGFDRLFVPDIHRFAVRVLDSEGNDIALIGGYGNMDNRGPDSQHPEPAIAYAWPLVAQVDGDRLYVADVTNRRIVAARLTYAVTETCDVKGR